MPHEIKPEALTAVILGARAEASKPVLADLLSKRQHQTGLILPVYQVRFLDSAIRIHRVKL
jgi:hypothetical protein